VAGVSGQTPKAKLWVEEDLSRVSFTCLSEAPILEKILLSKIITGNNQDSIALYIDVSVRKKVCSHILALMGEK
jgi:hypothetical protein